MLYVCVLCVVAVLNAAFCMTCSLLMLVEDERSIPQSRSHNCLVGSHECLLLFITSCCSECFYGLCVCTEMVWICVLYVSFGSKV